MIDAQGAISGTGDQRSALASCEPHRDNFQSQVCLAMVYYKLGRRADAQAVLTKAEVTYGDAAASQYA